MENVSNKYTHNRRLAPDLKFCFETMNNLKENNVNFELEFALKIGTLAIPKPL
jgi:hypothetical protein